MTRVGRGRGQPVRFARDRGAQRAGNLAAASIIGAKSRVKSRRHGCTPWHCRQLIWEPTAVAVELDLLPADLHHRG